MMRDGINSFRAACPVSRIVMFSAADRYLHEGEHVSLSSNISVVKFAQQASNRMYVWQRFACKLPIGMLSIVTTNQGDNVMLGLRLKTLRLG